MNAPWVSLTVELPDTEAEPLEELLHESGAQGLEVRDRDAAPMPGIRWPQPGRAIVVAYFEAGSSADAALHELRSRFPSARATREDVPAQDWSESWKSLVRAVEIGRLWVGPPWLASEASPERERVVIEPKMAFGTGDHPTTALCLEAIDAFLGRNPGASVLDVGTGTGVLAIAAKRLGAGRVVGIDNDPISVQLARENAATNRAADVVLSGETLDRIDGAFDLVVANIVANTLIELAPFIVKKVGKALVLAGVLERQREQVESAYVAQGLVGSGSRADGEWIRIDLRRP
jgi:ribosomal protein L11 methyltransferase